ncbi:NepR family anti-sigma factor [Hyphomicrobium sp. D-2]|uniref:NepR family anti-sigma factor n=1 Tax=Hyphomicrobium sp. D-2 TaxID=3041621 RepID=UPI0024546609|nr:NepR family anti-sigma factor [Hyphomicrobium sp. D-2]MDH4982009.1 NepR family anti-sigma factor [Hyphomicrobium sp. D-2]
MSEEKNAGWGKGAPPQSESVPTAAASAPLEQSPEAQAAASSHGSDTAQDISSSMVAGRDDGHEQGQEGEQSSPASGDLHAESTHQRVRDQDVLPEILGRQLRAAYGELLSTPLPDSITNLVKKLERREPTPSATNAKQRSGKESR